MTVHLIEEGEGLTVCCGKTPFELGLASRVTVDPALATCHRHRRFLLVRSDDITGMSGVGVVAEGVQFSDGVTVLRWLSTATARAHEGVLPTTVIHESPESVEALHGHNGATRIQWIDEIGVEQ